MTERQVRRNGSLRDTWFQAANEILASQGYGALKLAPLCQRLGVTTGSFYHSFDNWQDFTDALLDAWLEQRTQQTVDIVNQHADPVDRLLMLAEASSRLLHRTEAAIRVWAGVDERVGAIQRQVDEKRYQVVHAALVETVGAELAPRYASWALSTLVGFEMLADGHDREQLVWSLEQVLAAAGASR
ncbi:AcrR family transcriptional regulator [Nocardioides aromaticivorans]|uniref:AcrR family transcriptional regulator n=1 Tax=Nocardioides aromaticivorans TaxID=200618 RepID=A0A7Y9ZJA6_9ACTN|nr:TetR/AcrR family transcriptional regulator [Nocardioides aromaticivorans]NYI45383.1 AcrR family transcriptional regulator [Nocardioides aromaticivorans]